MALAYPSRKSFSVGNFPAVVLILVVLSYVNGECDPTMCDDACENQYVSVVRQSVYGVCNQPKSGTSQGHDYCACFDGDNNERLN